jgi:dipicolinic acid synthetase, B subunit
VLTIGFAVTGSFCTFSKAIAQMQRLVEAGFDVLPILSQISYETDTRFGKAEEFRKEIEDITGREIIHTINDAEPIGPKSMLDLLIIAPATGNTLAKLANGINDTPVTMAAKAHLRNQKPLLIAVSTNDALSACAQNIGRLLNVKNIYFVPVKQDDSIKKPTSVVADFELVVPAANAALKGQQLQPILL